MRFAAGKPFRILSATTVALVAVAVVSACSSSDSAPSPTSSGSTAASQSNSISLAILEPNDGVGPVVDFIRSAKHTVDIAIYEFDPEYKELVEPLLQAQQSGIKVRILLSRKLFDPGSKNKNIAAAAKFRSMGLDAQLSRPEFSYSHEKAVIADAGTPQARALVCDFNFQPGYFGLKSVESKDGGTRGMAVVDSDPADVVDIAATFNADWPPYGEWPAATRPNLVWSPSAPQFQPPGNSASALTGLIAGAKKSIDIYALQIALPSVMYQPLLTKARAGIPVRIVTNEGGVDSTAGKELAAAGVKFQYRPTTPGRESSVMFIHSKTVLVDAGAPSATAFVGSQNPFLQQSLETERELGTLVTDAPSLERISATFQRDFAS